MTFRTERFHWGDDGEFDWHPKVNVEDKFDPSQPRDPAGVPTGGQWSSGGGELPSPAPTPVFTTRGNEILREGKVVGTIKLVTGGRVELTISGKRLKFRNYQAALIHLSQATTELPNATETPPVPFMRKMTDEEIQGHINKVAKDADFPADRIKIEHGDHDFVLNGKHYFAAGTAYIHGDKTIKMWADHLEPWFTDGVIRHEIEHVQFQNALDERNREWKAITTEPSSSGPYGTDPVIAPDGSLRPPYDAKYPAYNAMYKAFESYSSREFAAADGVSDYSYEYWKGFKKGNVTFELAVHETLAEMARIKYETGKFPDHMGERIIEYRTVTYEEAMPKFKAAGISLDMTSSGGRQFYTLRKWGSDPKDVTGWIEPELAATRTQEGVGFSRHWRH